jgi:hypothetical protein
VLSAKKNANNFITPMQGVSDMTTLFFCLASANNCLKAMLDKLDSDSLPVKSAVCKFVADESVMDKNTTRQHHISFLNLAAKVSCAAASRFDTLQNAQIHFRHYVIIT